MSGEIKRIMEMVEEGRLSSEEATELLEALNSSEREETTESTQPYMKRSVKIRITSREKERLRLNIPIKFVKWVLKTGYGIAQAIPDAEPYMEDVDMDAIMQAIDNHEVGKIIDLETEEGETVMIYIE